MGRQGRAADCEFVELLRARSPALRRTAIFLCSGDVAEGEDLLQEALVRLYARWGGLRDLAAAEAYARTTMTRLSYRRAVLRRRRARGEAPERLTPDAAAGVDARAEVFSALQSLSPRQRAVIVLRYYDDLSEQDIARVLGCSVGAVKTHSSRAIAKLRSSLEGQIVAQGDP